MEGYKRGSHTVWECKYHLVWSTKYRYQVLGGDVGHRCRELLLETAHALAARLASGPSTALRIIKRAVYQGQRMDLRTHLDMISSHMAVIRQTEDHREGARAFVEKRAPEFKGR